MKENTADKFNKVAKFYNTPIFQILYLGIHTACFNFIKNYIKSNFKILDIACGTGIFLKKIDRRKKSLRLFGIDNSEGMISIAKKKPSDIYFTTADAEKIMFGNNFFDFITIIDAFYYFKNKETVFKECSRVLKPNHYLFIYYPALDIFPNFLLKQIKIISKLLFFNLEEFSEFPKLIEIQEMANKNCFRLVKKKGMILNRYLLFQKI